MAKVTDQDIPSELRELYELILQVATPWQEKTTVRKRYPWRLPQMQGNGLITPDWDIGPDVTPAQFNVRKMFARSVYFWGLQPTSGGATPPAIGPRNRSWWYTAAAGSGLWYYDYFIQQTIISLLAGITPDWCKTRLTHYGYADEMNPDTPYPMPETIRAYNAPWGGDTRTYIRTYFEAKTLWIYFFWSWDWPDPPEENIISVYEVTTPWHMDTLTWNNKPELGNLLHQFSVGPDYFVWDSIEIPSVYSIALVSETENILAAWMGEQGDPDELPFFSIFPP